MKFRIIPLLISLNAMAQPTAKREIYLYNYYEATESGKLDPLSKGEEIYEIYPDHCKSYTKLISVPSPDAPNDVVIKSESNYDKDNIVTEFHSTARVNGEIKKTTNAILIKDKSGYKLSEYKNGESNDRIIKMNPCLGKTATMKIYASMEVGQSRNVPARTFGGKWEDGVLLRMPDENIKTFDSKNQRLRHFKMTAKSSEAHIYTNDQGHDIMARNGNIIMFFVNKSETSVSTNTPHGG